MNAAAWMWMAAVNISLPVKHKMICYLTLICGA